MKKILGLDLGTNSIGWALVDTDEKKILGMGSRIIPMSQDVLDTFSGGKPLETQTAARTGFRGIRRIRERQLLRRERLHRVLNILGFLPEHYSNQIDFEKHFGQFVDESEPKLTYNNRNFIFTDSFTEMLSDFKQSQPQLFYTKPNGKETKIPHDWTIYYLRKKALSQKIGKDELAWIILNFNQKRGYYQLRGEDDTDATRTAQTRIYFDRQFINSIVDTGSVYKGLKVIQITLVNGDSGKYFSKEVPNWLGLQKNIIVTVDLDKDGNDKFEEDGTLKRRFSIPTEEDWEKKWKLIKIKTEKEIKDADKTVGAYIYENLLQNPSQKIRGKLVRTIERKFYKEELIAILKKQIELQPELFTEDLYNDCVRELYRNNEAQQLILSKRDFVHLFVEDIIFYQRPLRSQKSSIGNCPFEFRIHKSEDGKKVKKYLKVIPKSHPLYQEFRLWQWLTNLKIYRKEDDANVTTEFLKSTEDFVALFDFLMTQKEVGHKDIMKHLATPTLKEKFPNVKPAVFNKEIDKEIAKYRWNYVFDDSKEKEEDKSKKYPCNTTGYEIRRRLGKIENVPTDFLETTDTKEVEIRKGQKKGQKITVSLGTREYQLWHIIYSVTDKKEYEAALKSFANKYKLDENSFVEEFRKFAPFPSEYGAYSEKAINKLLPVMRQGKYWNWNIIDAKTQSRIQKIVSGEYDENIKTRVREKAINLTDNNHFQGLPIWLASYVIYDRHSEADIAGKWNSVAELEQYIEDFKQHSLRNPIVEQVVTETLRVVRDIWKKYGQGAKDFFSEIHIELGREMKNTADDRKYITEQVTNNEATNLRIKALLAELKENSDGKLLVDNVRPHSPSQQDVLRIYEDAVLNSTAELPEDIAKISKSAQPSKTELQRYKLWLEQKYRSPYTGSVIPLGRLFTEDYQIEHIIPKSRYFDDSFNNKVICEAAVNQLKDKQLGWEFIKNHHGEKVECGMSKVVEIFTKEEYQAFVKEYYAKNKTKRQNLLLDEIPEKMIARQMNDTRYISKYISSLLSNIVRADKEDDGVNSKNLIPGNGKITTALKQDWGLNNVWNDLVIPRFMRMNELTKTNDFTSINQEGHTIPAMPLELSKGFQKKRIDHRHHAMDALVVACMTRDHVQYLNNENAKSQKFHLQQGLARKLRRFEVVEISKMKKNEKGCWVKGEEKIEKEVPKEFFKPWYNFTVDAKTALETVVVSFKQNLRVINKATNNYQKWVIKNGKKVKEPIKQEGVNWAIRKPLHKETVSGKVILNRIKVPKGKLLTASRKNVDTTFNRKTIDSITDTGIQKILISFLEFKSNNPEIAFSPEGLEEMNNNIRQYNNGIPHKPVKKVRIFELGSKFPLGESGNKKEKFVEAAKGTNLFFAIYQKEDGTRTFETYPINVVIERLKQGLTEVPEINEKGEKLIFTLSPNDLVYVPSEEEKQNQQTPNLEQLAAEQVGRIYKMVSCTGTECYFINHHIASLIKPYDAKSKIGELGSINKLETSFDGIRIKEVCKKLFVDRLGGVTF